MAAGSPLSSTFASCPPGTARNWVSTRSAVRFLSMAVLPLLLAGCAGERTQSALHPASPAAATVARLWWILLGVCAAYTVIVLILLLLAVFRRPQKETPPRYGGRVFIVVGGIAVPAVILVVFLFFSLQTTIALRPPETSLTVQIIGHQWWWEVRYPEQNVVTANEIHIPVGEPVALELMAADVIHSFWVPELHGKIDLLPEKTNAFWIEAERAGTFRGQCAEYCGLQHAQMALVVVALPPDEFAAWVSERQVPTPDTAIDPLEEGRATFLRAGCADCHAIRGMPAVGRIGPDLTHIGSRRTIGAGVLPNNFGNLAGWISNPQAIKPGVKMPPSYIAPEELHALVEYLQSLK